jgi:hypothetical protein
MEQKKLLTLLPVMFLAIISIFLLMNRNVDNGEVLGECVDTFTDTGIDLNIPYPCDWELQLSTNVLPNFIANNDGTFGHPVQTYNVDMKDSGGELKVQISIIFAETEGTIIELDSDYDVFELHNGNKIVRFLSEDEKTYRYGEHVECGGKDCARTIIRGVTSNFPSVIQIYDLKNASNYDSLIAGILDRDI